MLRRRELFTFFAESFFGHLSGFYGSKKGFFLESTIDFDSAIAHRMKTEKSIRPGGRQQINKRPVTIFAMRKQPPFDWRARLERTLGAEFALMAPEPPSPFDADPR